MCIRDSPSPPPFAPGTTFVQPGQDMLQMALDDAKAILLVLVDGVYYGSSCNSSSFGVNRNVTIRASIMGQAILDGQDARRVLLISSGTVHLEGLVIRNGLASVSPVPRSTAHRPLPQDAHSCFRTKGALTVVCLALAGRAALAKTQTFDCYVTVQRPVGLTD
eukprot:3974715-Prymnesium_polylepis.2